MLNLILDSFVTVLIQLAARYNRLPRAGKVVVNFILVSCAVYFFMKLPDIAVFFVRAFCSYTLWFGRVFRSIF